MAFFGLIRGVAAYYLGKYFIKLIMDCSSKREIEGWWAIEGKWTREPDPFVHFNPGIRYRQVYQVSTKGGDCWRSLGTDFRPCISHFLVSAGSITASISR